MGGGVVSDRDVQIMKKESAIVSKKFMVINVFLQPFCFETLGCASQRSFAGINKFLTYYLEKWPWYLEAVVHACLIYSNASSIYSLQEILRAWNDSLSSSKSRLRAVVWRRDGEELYILSQTAAWVLNSHWLEHMWQRSPLCSCLVRGWTAVLVRLYTNKSWQASC